eukprot:9322968-Alexandrium_andersonii.AAC.1
MDVEPPGMARSERNEDFSRRGRPSVGSGGSRENKDHRSIDGVNEAAVDARPELPMESGSGVGRGEGASKNRAEARGHRAGVDGAPTGGRNVGGATAGMVPLAIAPPHHA